MRVLFQLVASLIFMYQMQQSISKYIRAPIVKELAESSLYDITKPVIYICKQDQFNTTAATQIGYDWEGHYLAGIHNNGATIFNWKGNSSGVEYDDLLKALYVANYTGVEVQTYDEIKVAFEQVETEVKFIMPYGFCERVDSSKIEETMFVLANQNIKLIIVDLNLDDGIQIKDEASNHIEVDFNSNEAFDYVYEVVFMVENDQMHNGKSCHNYEEIGQSYKDCLKASIEEQFLDWFGCIPPWYNSSSYNSCSQARSKKIPDITLQKRITWDIYHLLTNRPLNFSKKCLPPCRKLIVNINKVFSRTTIQYSWVNLVLNKDVKVFTDVYSYDVFCLIVDLGSSLGLWLGLSVLSILDYIILNAGGVRRLICAMTTDKAE